MNEKYEEIPLGFGIALAQNEKAFNNFAYLTQNRRNEYIERAHAVQSKDEMQQLVMEIENVEV